MAGPENSIIQGQLQHICLIINYFEIHCQKNIIMQDSIFFLHKILFFENNIFKKFNTFTNNIISVIAAKILGI